MSPHQIMRLTEEILNADRAAQPRLALIPLDHAAGAFIKWEGFPVENAVALDTLQYWLARGGDPQLGRHMLGGLPRLLNVKEERQRALAAEAGFSS